MITDKVKYAECIKIQREKKREKKNDIYIYI